MKALMMISIFVVLTTLTIAQVHVRGYTKKDGTVVQPYTRSSPDNNPYNNYSYPGNTNPYTGKVATGNPQTYLDNYYNRSSLSSINTTSGSKVYLKDSNGQSTGGYLKLFNKSNIAITYDVYTPYNVYDGYIVYLFSGKAKVYSKDAVFVTEFETNPPSSNNASTYSNTPSVSYNSSSTNTSSSTTIKSRMTDNLDSVEKIVLI